jgi:hypothetical protein
VAAAAAAAASRLPPPPKGGSSRVFLLLAMAVFYLNILSNLVALAVFSRPPCALCHSRGAWFDALLLFTALPALVAAAAALWLNSKTASAKVRQES